jgi:putative aldouronate transport system substrate-binding protein
VQGAYADLTPYLTGEAIKEFPNLAVFPQQLWKNVALKGKIYGVPRPRFLTANPLVFRQDWAERAGIPRVKNADDVSNVLTAFTKNDPDGNGQADTWGLGSTNAVKFSFAFFAWMFRAPNGWRLNPDGSLTSGIETEEHKQALAFARKLFAAGAYHPDAAALTSQQTINLFTANTIGAYFDGVLALPGKRIGPAQNNYQPENNVIGLIPPGHDGGKAVTHNSEGIFGWAAMPAKVSRDRERVKELLRLLDYLAAPLGSEERLFLDNGLPGVHHDVQPNGTIKTNDLLSAERGALHQMTNPPQVFYYQNAPEVARYMQQWSEEMLAIGLDNPTAALFSQTATTRGGELGQLLADKQAAVILGREPLAAWDQTVRDWRDRGGDQIRKEYEEALKG